MEQWPTYEYRLTVPSSTTLSLCVAERAFNFADKRVFLRTTQTGSTAQAMELCRSTEGELRVDIPDVDFSAEPFLCILYHIFDRPGGSNVYAAECCFDVDQGAAKLEARFPSQERVATTIDGASFRITGDFPGQSIHPLVWVELIGKDTQ